MRKVLKSILCFGMAIGIIGTVSKPVFASPIKNSTPTNKNFSATLIDNNTGKKVNNAIKDIKHQSSEISSSDGVITETYKVNVTIPTSSITTLDSSGGSKEEGGCEATLKISYNLSSNNEKIQITKISGGWNPSSLVVVSDREAAVTDGRIPPFNKILRKNPTSNSFNYSTGWGYVDFVPGTDYTGARGYTEATLSVPGMGGTHNLFLTVAIDK